ncbi:hypothetical protein HGRIS_014871 [Hohenbuehelia grisea]|uniref:Uncharacterized protein n=1 Tax=Hohenbuehelia grisea TaxID=104357 RepID=A0ABR3IQZ8_9AGAR
MDGNFTRFITVEVSGEMDSFKTQINQMVFTLRDTIVILSLFSRPPWTNILIIFSHRQRFLADLDLPALLARTTSSLDDDSELATEAACPQLCITTVLYGS